MVSQFMGVLRILASIFSSGIIQGVVQAIEAIYKEYTGAQKKEVAMSMLLPLVPVVAKPLVAEAVDAQVSEFNDAGVFKHKAAPVGPDSSGSGPGLVIDSFAR